MTLKLNNFVIASLALAKLQFINYIFYIITIFIHINDIFTSIISYHIVFAKTKQHDSKTYVNHNEQLHWFWYHSKQHDSKTH